MQNYADENAHGQYLRQYLEDPGVTNDRRLMELGAQRCRTEGPQFHEPSVIGYTWVFQVLPQVLAVGVFIRIILHF